MEGTSGEEFSTTEEDNNTDFLTNIYNYITQGQYPPDRVKDLNYKRTIRRAASLNFRVLNGQLQFRKSSKPVEDVQTQTTSKETSASPWKIVLRSKTERQQVIQELHGGPLGKLVSL